MFHAARSEEKKPRSPNLVLVLDISEKSNLKVLLTDKRHRETGTRLNIHQQSTCCLLPAASVNAHTKLLVKFVTLAKVIIVKEKQA